MILKFFDCVLKVGEDYFGLEKFLVVMERVVLKVIMKVDKSENFLFGRFLGKLNKCG